MRTHTHTHYIGSCNSNNNKISDPSNLRHGKTQLLSSQYVEPTTADLMALLSSLLAFFSGSLSSTEVPEPPQACITLAIWGDGGQFLPYCPCKKFWGSLALLHALLSQPIVLSDCSSYFSLRNHLRCSVLPKCLRVMSGKDKLRHYMKRIAKTQKNIQNNQCVLLSLSYIIQAIWLHRHHLNLRNLEWRLFKFTVTVFYGCCHKLPQSQWLKTTQIYCLSVLEGIKMKVLAELPFFWRLLGRVCFLAFSSFQGLWSLVSFSIFKYPQSQWCGIFKLFSLWL